MFSTPNYVIITDSSLKVSSESAGSYLEINISRLVLSREEFSKLAVDNIVFSAQHSAVLEAVLNPAHSQQHFKHGDA